LVETSGA